MAGIIASAQPPKILKAPPSPIAPESAPPDPAVTPTAATPAAPIKPLAPIGGGSNMPSLVKAAQTGAPQQPDMGGQAAPEQLPGPSGGGVAPPESINPTMRASADGAPATGGSATPPDPYGIGATTHEVTSDELVSANLEKLLSGNSPLIARARARANEEATSRGLQNSTMAAQAGEAAAIDSMLPVAQGDAGTYSRQALANMDATNQFSGMDKTLAGNERLAGQDRTWRSGESVLDRAQQEKLQSAELKSREGIASMQLAASQADANARIAIANKEIESRSTLAQQQLDQQWKLAGMDDTTRRFLAQMDVDSRTALNTANLSANALSTYSNLVANIFSGPGEQADKINNFRMISALYQGAPNFPLNINLAGLPSAPAAP